LPHAQIRLQPLHSVANKVPDSRNWLHEFKHYGYRLIVQRDGKQVRLWTRNGHNGLTDTR
jgi:ATP-dependent DNA ligase